MNTPDAFLAAFYAVLRFHAELKEADEVAVWSRIVETLSTVLEAEAATYYCYLQSKRQLLPLYALGVSSGDLKGTAIDIRTGLCGWVAVHREPLLIADAYKDDRFLREVDAVTGFRTQSVLAVPLMDRLELTGVIQLLNKRAGFFTQQDLHFVDAVCRSTSHVLRMLTLEGAVDTQRRS